MKPTTTPRLAALTALSFVLAACATPNATNTTVQESPVVGTPPIAAGHAKFLGSAHSAPQAQDFARYWNKVTPENAGKWGEVEAQRDRMDWAALDAAYELAKSNGLPFQMHVLVWGNQQPEWIKTLPPAEQRAEIEQWFAAVAQRYPDIDIVEVVNEPLHDPPSKDDEGGGNYIEALGGEGETGWDWVLEAFRLARTHFPDSRLMLNDYSITNTPDDAKRYVGIIELLQQENLIDVIGVQGHAFSTTLERPVEVHRANLDLLAATGLPIHVTEFDVDGPTDAIQLQDYRRIFPLFWEHPAVEGVTLWGFRPGLWRSEQGAQLIREDGSERPALEWLRRYVQGEATPAIAPLADPRIERFDPALDAILNADALVEPLAEGFTWAEGPAWIDDGGYLLFTDVPQNVMYRWSADAGLAVFEQPSGYAGPPDPALREAGANGLWASGDGSLLLADSGNRALVRLDLASRERKVLASTYLGRRLNSPNDVIGRADGNLYFTDPPYGLVGLDASPVKELNFNGVYRIDRNGSLHLIDDNLSFPNGVALSPDGNTLYVANSDPRRPVWIAYTLDEGGAVIDRRVFADASDLIGEGVHGLPDGLAVGDDGHLFATAPGGVLVMAPDGRRLGRIVTGGPVANVGFGDDGRTLYLTAHRHLARVRLSGSGRNAAP